MSATRTVSSEPQIEITAFSVRGTCDDSQFTKPQCTATRAPRVGLPADGLASAVARGTYVQMRNVERRTVRGTLWYPNRAQPWPKSARGGITGAGTSRPVVTVRSPTGPVRSEPGVPETGVAGASQQQLIDRVEGQGVFCCGQCELEPVFAWLLPCA